MKAVVVHESLWGNTTAVARAIAEGFGPRRALVDTYLKRNPQIRKA